MANNRKDHTCSINVAALCEASGSQCWGQGALLQALSESLDRCCDRVFVVDFSERVNRVKP